MKRKRKLLDLTTDCIKQLTIKAAKEEKLFKPYVEEILEKKSKEK